MNRLYLDYINLILIIMSVKQSTVRGCTYAQRLCGETTVYAQSKQLRDDIDGFLMTRPIDESKNVFLDEYLMMPIDESRNVFINDYFVLLKKIKQHQLLFDNSNYFCMGCKEFYTDCIIINTTNACTKCKGNIIQLNQVVI
jgi:hypothetical protein